MPDAKFTFTSTYLATKHRFQAFEPTILFSIGPKKMTIRPSTLTRRELFDLVWSTPVATLAQEFGMSDRGLTKLCARHKIPTPPRGYWAKIQTGGPQKIPAFKEVEDPWLQTVRFTSPKLRWSDDVRELVEQQKAMRALREGSEAVQLSTETQHPAVEKLARKLRKLKPRKDGIVTIMGEQKHGIAVQQSNIERTISILNEIAAGLTQRGLEFSFKDKALSVQLNQDKIAFRLIEKQDRTKHIPTESELAKKERQDKRYGYRAFDWQKDPWPEFDYSYNGQLSLSVDIWADGLRKTWGDGKRQRIDTMIPGIVDGLEILVVHTKSEREKREEWHRQAEIRQHQRHLAQLREERESKRISILTDLMSAEEEANRLRLWLNMQKRKTDIGTSRELTRFLSWAQGRLDLLEKQIEISSIHSSLIEDNLFPDQDELVDPYEPSIS